MQYDADQHHRRSLRLRDYDYSQVGAYFVTIVVQNRECVLGEIADGALTLSPIGQTANDFWEEIPRHFPNVALDEFVVMPNHIHGSVVIARQPVQHIQPPEPTQQRPGDPVRSPSGTTIHPDADEPVGVEYIQPLQTPPPQNQYQHVIPKSLGSVIRSYKAAVTRWCNTHGHDSFRWQRNYWEHVIRDEGELIRVRAYIAANPSNWSNDENNPMNVRP